MNSNVELISQKAYFLDPSNFQITSYEIGQFLSQPKIWEGAKNSTQIIIDCFSRFANSFATSISKPNPKTRDVFLNEVDRCVSHGLENRRKMNYAQKLISNYINSLNFCDHWYCPIAESTKNLIKPILKKGTFIEVDNFIKAISDKFKRGVFQNQYVMHLLQIEAPARVEEVLNKIEDDYQRGKAQFETVEHLLQHNDFENAKSFADDITEKSWKKMVKILFAKYHLELGEVDEAKKISEEMDCFEFQADVQTHIINHYLQQEKLIEAEETFNNIKCGECLARDQALFSFLKYHLKHGNVEGARESANHMSPSERHPANELFYNYFLDNDMLDDAQIVFNNARCKIEKESFRELLIHYYIKKGDYKFAQEVISEMSPEYRVNLLILLVKTLLLLEQSKNVLI